MLPEEEVLVVVPVLVVDGVVMVLLAAVDWEMEPVAEGYQPLQVAVLAPSLVSAPRVLVEAC